MATEGITMGKINIEPDWVFSPQPMYIIGTKNEDGTPNFCIITWLGFSFDKTPHLMMTVGGTKLTKSNILREGCFTANMITEDTLWLADYFGCTNGEDGLKNKVPYQWRWAETVSAPVVDDCPWVYECKVTKTLELDGVHLFLAEIQNIQIEETLGKMDMKKIDLRELKPAIYAPYNYFSIGEKLGEMDQWKEHIQI